MANIRSLYKLPEVTGYTPKNLPATEVQNKVTSKELIGIEIEVENLHAAHNDPNPVWTVKTDGSLRNNGAEFVTRPIEAHYAPAALTYLLQEYLQKECCFSPRTSVHVHLNMHDMEQDKIIDFLVAYSVFERLLYRFAGRGRIKNIYCVPITETNLLGYLLSRGIRPDRWSKYTGLNLACLRDYGTVEFRHMHGTFDVEKLCAWINLITSIKEYVLNTSTKDIRSSLFKMDDFFDYAGLMGKVFGEHSKHLKLQSGDDIRHCYMQAKSICMKNTHLVRIQSSLSPEAPFFKGK